MKHVQKSKQLLSFKKKSFVTLVGFFGFLLFFVSAFLVTRGAYPHTSELSFIEHSISGTEGGSVVPASCNSAPPTSHFLGDCTAICPATGLAYDPYLNPGACPAAVPTASIALNPTNVSWNGASTISWSSTNSTSCTGSGYWTIGLNTFGTSNTGGATTTRTYRLQCSNAGGNSSLTSATLAVCPYSTPLWNGTICSSVSGPATASLTATPINISYNTSSLLSWSSTNSTTCTGGGAWSGQTSTTGSAYTASLTSDTTYTLYCSNSGGDSATQTITVRVCPAGTPVWNGGGCVVSSSAPTASISATPSNINYNAQTTISWNSTNSTGCTASGDWNGTKGTVGSVTLGGLITSHTYNIHCTNGVIDSTTVSTTTNVCPISTPTWNGTACVASVGNLTSNTCTIPTGSGSCNMNVIWSVTNPSGIVTVTRPYAGNTVLGSGPTSASAANPYVFPYSATPYTLDLNDGAILLDTGTFSASCAVGGYDTIGAACANPSGVASVTGDIYGPGFFNFTCTNANGYIVRRDGTTISTAAAGTYTSGTPVSLPIAITGNYQVECIQGDYGVLVPAVLFNAPPPPDALISISATPRTISKDSAVTLKWDITYPINACVLTAKAVCTNGICSTAQLASQTAINAILSGGTTDISDPVGSRPIPTAVNTIAAGYASTYKAVGRKTMKISNTMDFTINCGVSSKKATARVLVTKSDEQ